VALLRAKRREEASQHFAQAARADPHDHAARSNLEVVTQVGGGFLFFFAFRVLVQSVSGWARVAAAVAVLLAGLVLLLVVREARTSRLPDDAERFVRAQRRVRRRRLADPRNWWPAISSNWKRSAFIAGFAALVIVFIFFVPAREERREPEREVEFPTLEELCESPPFSDPAFRPSTCP
jgi:protein-S-isoprenylcysteine O-methyltransferase Ste14